MVISTVPSLGGVDLEPRFWTRTILFGIAVVVLCVQVARFALWQRDEYWRERGRDPSTLTGFRRLTLNSSKVNKDGYQQLSWSFN